MVDTNLMCCLCCVNCASVFHQGQKFTADLLPDGKIKWREAGRVFSSPSAWAIHCKKIVNPMKKSGCGWASVILSLVRKHGAYCVYYLLCHLHMRILIFYTSFLLLSLPFSTETINDKIVLKVTQ